MKYRHRLGNEQNLIVSYDTLCEKTLTLLVGSRDICGHLHCWKNIVGVWNLFPGKFLSQISRLSFLCFPMDSPALGCAELCLCPLPSGRAWGSPSGIRDPRAAKPLCFGMYPQALQKPDPLRFGTAPWGPWSQLGQAGFRGKLLHGMAGGLARSRASLPVTLTWFPVKESMKSTHPAKRPKLIQSAFF